LFNSACLFEVGGMTELELGVELDLSGPELVLAVSRYRRSITDTSNCSTRRRASTTADIPSLHWRDIGLEQDESYSKISQLVETCEDISGHKHKSSHLSALHQVTRTCLTSTNDLKIPNHFSESGKELKNDIEAHENKDDDVFEEAKSCNKDTYVTEAETCNDDDHHVSTKPVETAFSNVDLVSEQLNGDDVTLKRILRNLDLKVIS
jgi:hypothetical protein